MSGSFRVLLACLCALSLLSPGAARAYEQITWEDLTEPVDPAADPFHGLDSETRLRVETILGIANLRARGEPLLDEEIAEEAEAARWLEEAGTSAAEVLRKNDDFMAAITRQSSTVRREWDGKDVRIPGYIVPLEFDGAKTVEFLLVPYVGACIHVPPPPANQIILVRSPSGVEIDGLFTPVWVMGRLAIEMSQQSVALSDGSTGFDVSYSLNADSVELYR